MNLNMFRPWSFVLLSSFVLCHSSFGADISNPLSPADAQKAFRLADSGLMIELVAAEPDVIDPVAIRFDEDGRMWVVQMTDYPLGNPTGGEPLSKIRVLEDRDGDGRFETATTFADKLLFATGLQPWKGGAFVTMSGKLVYMKDTDGDGRSDQSETWFEGFAEQNSQLRANHPRLALDNWIYVANGLRGGKVINRKLGETEPINISGMDFRFNPLTGAAEAVSGNGQFGLSFDDWGNRFVCSNRNPVKHVVIEDRYLKANPGVAVPATVDDVAASGEQSHIFPISRAWTTSNLHAGQFTAACGVYIYRGDLLPAEFKGNAFTCDPTGNLIHREIMEPAGPTFKSKPAYEGKEFLASPDEWFRPVNMELGPDGALYVVDMYRCVIEHPDFVPDELKRRPDLRLGDDRGRIWRLVPSVGRSVPERPAPRAKPALSKATSEELVALLEHPNAWQREAAQRLLLERGADSVSGPLVRATSNGQSQLARAHAIWLLASAGSSKRQAIATGLQDVHQHVIRQALLAMEVYENGDWDAGVVERLSSHPAAPVRFQARLSFSLTGAPQVLPIERVKEDASDPWLRRSIVFAARTTAELLLSQLLSGPANQSRRYSPGEVSLIEELSELAAANDKGSLGNNVGFASLTDIKQAEVGLAALRGMYKVWARKGVPRYVGAPTAVAARLQELADDPKLDLSIRASAVSLLGYAGNPARYCDKHHEQPIRIAAIGALARTPGTDSWQPLMDDFSSDTPPVRRAIIDGLLSNADRTKMLLDAIESGRVKTSEIDLTQAKRLTTYRDVSIRDRAQKLFAAAMPADRTKALADYQPVLAMKGDAQHGQVIFEKNCAVCHRIAGIGVNVAPDISDSRTKKPEQILADILQPNRAIDNNYLGYTVRQTDGTVLTGILAAETATSITLRQQGGKDAVIPRSDIDELRSTGQSLMPEGLERQIPQQDMADLVSFIKNWRYLDGRTPLSDSAGR